MGYVSYEWVISHMSESCPTYKPGMSDMNGVRDIHTVHVSCEWMSHVPHIMSKFHR